ncbi:MAG TPA: hypothetical protein DER33_01525 [Syntrophomonas sp.]|jgi:hypothetical protein|nr:hypothetical protein [Syntrophomonas sp.]HCF70268.1 hypothetical protein [Syntrophomonas sp.]
MICPKCKEQTGNGFPCSRCGFNPETSKWVIIARVYPPNDVIIESLLRSYEIPAKFIREAIGTVQGLSIGPLAEVKIAVPEEIASETAEIIKSYDDEP